MGVSELLKIVTPDSTSPPATHEDLIKIVRQLERYSVIPFASATERTALYATLGITPHAGAVSYLQDVGYHEFFNAVSWVALSGVWATWTPAYTNMGVGNGVVSGRFRRVGKTIDFRWKLILGTTSSIGSGPSFTLPVSPLHGSYAQFDIVGDAMYGDTGTGTRRGKVLATAALDGISFFSFDETTGLTVQLSATSPHTWASTDVIAAWGSYELA